MKFHSLRFILIAVAASALSNSAYSKGTKKFDPSEISGTYRVIRTQICHSALSEPDGTPTMYVQTDSNGRQTVASRVKTIVTSSSQVRIVKIGGTSLIETARENRTFPTSPLEPGVNGIATFYPKDENFSAEFPIKVDLENGRLIVFQGEAQWERIYPYRINYENVGPIDPSRPGTAGYIYTHDGGETIQWTDATDEPNLILKTVELSTNPGYIYRYTSYCNHGGSGVRLKR